VKHSFHLETEKLLRTTQREFQRYVRVRGQVKAPFMTQVNLSERLYEKKVEASPETTALAHDLIVSR